MRLSCQSCFTPFQPADINAELGLASCRRCNAVFDLKARAASEEKPAVSARVKVPLPPRFKVEEEPGVLRLSWRWFTMQTLLLLLFCIAWDSFLTFWYGIALTAKNTPWIMVVFPIGHLAVGVGLTYSTIASLFNRSIVEVGLDTLRVRHGPIPWRGNVSLSAEDVVQVFCEESSSRTRSGVSVRYSVNAVLHGNRTVRLLSGLEDRQQALYIEQAIERRLRIPDAVVPGEQPRSAAG